MAHETKRAFDFSFKKSPRGGTLTGRRFYADGMTDAACHERTAELIRNDFPKATEFLFFAVPPRGRILSVRRTRTQFGVRGLHVRRAAVEGK